MSRRPNILFLLTDQHSPHIAGFAGDRVVDTAALDGVAEDGVRFDAAYCQAPLCGPSRMSLLTGLWSLRWTAWAHGPALTPGHETIPGWLSKHGYTTASAGKMHFDDVDQMHGFQFRPYGDLVKSRAATHQPDPPDTADGRWNRHAVGRFPFAGPTAIPESLLMESVTTVESLAWLLEFSDQEPDTPWFFCASYSRPHFPLTAPGRYLRKYLASELKLPPLPPGYPDRLHPHDRFIVDDFNLLNFSDEEHRKALAGYYACVDYVDDCMGALLEGLRRSGRLDNTYIVYTSDHGDMAGEHGLWWKRTYYDASAGVPLLISGPGIEGNRAVSTPVELVDLFPTFCEWAEVDAPPGLDGESLVPLLNGRPDRRKKRMARSELIADKPGTEFRMVRDERWKYVDFPSAPARLFDLSADPDETNDVGPDPPGEAPVDAFQAMLDEGGSWEEVLRRIGEERTRLERYPVQSRGTVQHRLADGRIIEADADLYETG